MNTPFKRFFELTAKVEALLRDQMLSHDLKHAAINQLLASHKNRGKGGKGRARGSRMKITAQLRAQQNKFKPHQGQQEIARRAT